jgi:adenosine deaminase
MGTGRAAVLDTDGFLRRLPKVELHCHLEGSVRPATLADLARTNGVPLPREDPEDLYEYEDLEGFLAVYGLVCRSVVQREDFARITYESLEDGVRLGNLRYREMFFNPTLHMQEGVPYADVIGGVVEGVRSAETDLGVRCRLIPSIYRQDPLPAAMEMLEAVLADRPDEVIGLGMDGDELRDPPERFAPVYKEAGNAGLRLTAHVAHDGPAALIVTCLDGLGCERIDHGYHVLDDPQILTRTRDEGVPFACSLGCPPLCGWPAELSRSPIKAMVDQGLWVTLNSDDPPMLHTDIGTDYVRFCGELGYGPAKGRELALAAVDACWLDDGEKRELRRAFEAEIDALERELLGP